MATSETGGRPPRLRRQRDARALPGQSRPSQGRHQLVRACGRMGRVLDHRVRALPAPAQPARHGIRSCALVWRGSAMAQPARHGIRSCAPEVLDALRAFCSVDGRGFMSSLFCLDHLRAVGPPYFVNQEGYSGVVLKAWSVKVVVMVCSGGSGAPSPLRLDSASRMVGRRLACRDAAGSRDRHLTREHVT